MKIPKIQQVIALSFCAYFRIVTVAPFEFGMSSSHNSQNNVVVIDTEA
jgi:hypothetical protein